MNGRERQKKEGERGEESERRGKEEDRVVERKEKCWKEAGSCALGSFVLLGEKKSLLLFLQKHPNRWYQHQTFPNSGYHTSGGNLPWHKVSVLNDSNCGCCHA